jgi:hypothetical protein
MDGVTLLGLMLGDFQHLHGENAEAIFLELLNDVADGILADGVGLDDGECALQSFHKSVVGPRSLVVGRCRSSLATPTPGSPATGNCI